MLSAVCAIKLDVIKKSYTAIFTAKSACNFADNSFCRIFNEFFYSAYFAKFPVD